MCMHIFKTRLKCLLRDRGTIFWTLMFPLVLAVFFNFALGNIYSSDSFSSIPVAVVKDSSSAASGFTEAMKSASQGSGSSGQKLFKVKVTSRSKAQKDLEGGKIKGYVFFDDGLHVAVKESDIDQTVIREFADSYLQVSASYRSIMKIAPSAGASFVPYSSENNIRKTKSGDPDDGIAGFFYALIAMAVMFGGYWGQREVEDIQADMSPVGARSDLAPVSKMKAFGCSFCAAVCIQFASLLILIAFLILVLGVSFGHDTGYIAAVCFFGSITGVSFGAFVAVLIRGSSHLRTSVILAVSMLLSCFAGLMSVTLKYTVTHAFPLMAYVNPANLVSDAFYSLYYYSTYTRLFINIGCMCIMSALFFTVVCLILRRRRYASL